MPRVQSVIFSSMKLSRRLMISSFSNTPLGDKCFLRVALNQQPACAAALLCRQAAALQLAHGMYPHLESMGQLFKFLESQHLKTCDEVSVA